MQNILNRILANKELDVHIVNFGDKVSRCSEGILPTLSCSVNLLLVD